MGRSLCRRNPLSLCTFPETLIPAVHHEGSVGLKPQRVMAANKRGNEQERADFYGEISKAPSIRSSPPCSPLLSPAPLFTASSVTINFGSSCPLREVPRSFTFPTQNFSTPSNQVFTPYPISTFIPFTSSAPMTFFFHLSPLACPPAAGPSRAPKHPQTSHQLPTKNR